MPLIEGLYATTIWKAFVLNALLSSLVIVLTIQVKTQLDYYYDPDPNKRLIHTSARSLLLTFLVCFVTAFLAYLCMHAIFGFGGGMLIEGAQSSSLLHGHSEGSADQI